MSKRTRTSSATSITDFFFKSTPSLIADLLRSPRRVRFASSSTSIDWNQELELERVRRHELSQVTGTEGVLLRAWDSTKPWIVIVSTGVLLGCIVSSIDIITDWLTDLRVGLCRERWWMSRDVCCIGIEDHEICHPWQSWAMVLGLRSAALSAAVPYVIYISLGTLFALVSSFLVVAYAPLAYHTGIPEIKAILGGCTLPGFLSLPTLVIKALGLPLAVASGLTLGKEGPLVHVACCISAVFIRAFDVIDGSETKKREILSAGAAAGISTAFGAPLGGVLFALEEVATFFTGSAMWQSFVCAIVAAVTLQYIDPYNTGRLALFELTETQVWRGFELVPWLLIGLAGGLWGSLFIVLNREWDRIRKALGISNTNILGIIEVTILSAFTAAVSYLVVFMQIPNTTLVQHLFHGCTSQHADPYGVCDTDHSFSIVLLLLITAITKTLLAACTIGAAIPAGILFPSLTIGACFGRLVGILFYALQKALPESWAFTKCPPGDVCISPAVYSVIGAASFAGGVTRMTLSLVVIMFELTGAIDLVLQMMMVVMISKFTADVFSRDGVYEMWIDVFAYPFINQKLDYKRDSLTARDVMTDLASLKVIPSRGEMRFGTARGLVDSSSYSGFPVVRPASPGEAPVLIGFASRFDLIRKMDEFETFPYVSAETACYFESDSPSMANFVNLSSCVNYNPTTLSADAPMELIVQLFRDLGVRCVLLTTPGGRLAGLMTKQDVHRHINSGEGAT